MTDFPMPFIGKNVIETLTSGMYEDARFIFREYVQNSADQIDVAVEKGILNKRSDGEIKINIDKACKSITIEDNATGIKAGSIWRFLGDVANSEKDQTIRRGFRGIGRLGGLGYCEKLVFETSYPGELIQSRMTLNAKLLRSIILDKNDNSDAAAVISLITDIDTQEESSESHYFRVNLINVTNEDLLNEDNVKEYLSMVAPVPFLQEFSFKDEINNYFKENNVIIDEFNIQLNEKRLYKIYKMVIDNGKKSTIVGVDFFKVNDELGNLLALGWYGFGNYINIVLAEDVPEGGLRLRKSNIQIGNRHTLDKLFKNKRRTNQRLIGELHVFSSQLIPNARRDYFNDNKTLSFFEAYLEEFIDSQNWEGTLAQTASTLHNRLREVVTFQKTEAEFERLKDVFSSVEEENSFKARYLYDQKVAVQAKQVIKKVEKKASVNKNIKKIYDSIIQEDQLLITTNQEAILTNKKYDPPTFSKLSNDQAEVAKTIISLIFESLPPPTANMLKKKIVDKFN